MREGALALGRHPEALPGAWALPGPGPGPQLSSHEPDSRGGWSLPTLRRPSSLSNLCCRRLMTLFSSLVSPLAMSSSLWAAVATLAILAISVLAMSSSFCPSRPCPCLPRARGTGPSCGGGQSTARWHLGHRSLVGRRGPQGVLQEGLCRVRPVQGVLPPPGGPPRGGPLGGRPPGGPDGPPPGGPGGSPLGRLGGSEDGGFSV